MKAVEIPGERHEIEKQNASWIGLEIVYDPVKKSCSSSISVYVS